VIAPQRRERNINGKSIPCPVVIPAKAGIQYAAAFAENLDLPGVLGRPVKPGDDR
jgi:hypothetical protein